VRIRELSPDETAAAHPAMLALRPHIGDAEHFVSLVNTVLRREGYRLVAAFLDDADHAAAVAGFREVHLLAWGHALYCDDLSTHPDHRRRGCAGALMDWMIAEAKRLGCDEFHLDSGVQPERQDAHRLYFDKRMRIAAHHFQMDLRGRPSPDSR
jgi:GNAT superfamily N-acetyltransferase